MAMCEVCGHEYLDSYESCPFCARAALQEQAPASSNPYASMDVGSRRPTTVLIVFGAGFLLAGLLGYGAVATFGGSADADDPSGTGYGSEDMTGMLEMVGDVSCFAEQAEVEALAMQYEIETGMVVTDPSLLVPDWLDALPVCPGGGTYTLEQTGEGYALRCSEHGHRFDEGGAGIPAGAQPPPDASDYPEGPLADPPAEFTPPEYPDHDYGDYDTDCPC